MAELPLILLWITEYVVMASTVHPERKLMVSTLMIPKASKTGLIIMPPPIPHMAPMIEAKKQIQQERNIDIFTTPLYII